jgi:hypothetical protein
MENVTLKDNLNNFFSALRSIIFLKDTSLINHACLIFSEGCIMHSLDESNITFINSHFRNVTSLERDNILIYDSSFCMENTSFSLTHTKVSKGSCLSGINSNFIIKYANFFSFNGNAIYIEDSTLLISNSIMIDAFNKSNENKYGALICLDCSEIKIINTTFKNNKAFQGAALYFFDSKAIRRQEKYIIDSFFQDNEAEKGGAIYIENQNIFVNGSIFIENKAIDGGAIFSFIESKYIF